MAPRLPAPSISALFNLSSLLHALPASTTSRLYAPCAACLFSTSPTLESIKKKRKVRKRIDPYRAAQARQRKAANTSRQGVLEKDRREAMGDPVRSTTTPFIQSFGSVQQPSTSDIESSPPPMNFFLNSDELYKSLAYSRYLTEPLPPADANLVDPAMEAKRLTEADEAHYNARRALAAIASLENGSSKDRTRANIQRCIDELGRHNTDLVLPPKVASFGSFDNPKEATSTNPNMLMVTKRVGPDTGSSEVQAAILTAKINTLADDLGKKDKHNKRNLRVMVHKRQKLLAYLRRKERGGPRWQNLVEKLGISDAMWKGEISL